MTGIMDRAYSYETVGSTGMKLFSEGSRILFKAIHAVWTRECGKQSLDVTDMS